MANEEHQPVLVQQTENDIGTGMSAGSAPGVASDPRRGFLKRSSLLLTVLAGAGLVRPDEASAANPIVAARAKVMEAVVQEAITTKNMDEAIKKFGTDLPPDLVSALRQLTPEELAQAAEVRPKLQAIRKALLGDEEAMNGSNNTGGYGM